LEIKRIIAELKAERDRIAQVIASIENLGSPGRRGRPEGRKAGGRRRKRRLTPEGRKRLSEMMKKRWAERRKRTKAST
jgi:Spy/CpxP family protein refolding chaperone